jgi:hypothetical protein
MNKDFETGVVFDRDGNIVIDKRGEEKRVVFTQEEGLKMKDCVFTHNHPTGWSYDENSIKRIGNSFSKEDLITAIKCDLKEMRAVTPNYTFSLKRPEKGWGVSFVLFEEKFDFMNEELSGDFYDRINNGTLTPMQASATHYHILMKEFAKLYGWDYTKSKTR